MTMRALNRTLVVITVAACVGIGGCSRESRDWRSAQAADSLESYDHFLESHPDSERAAQARARLLQLTEERDWQRASAADTADAYKQFLNQHSNGKWSAEARIRAENFALESQPFSPAPIQSAGASIATAPHPVGAIRASASSPSTHLASARSDAASTSASFGSPASANAGSVSAPPTGSASSNAATANTPVVDAASASSGSPGAPSDSAASFGIQLGAFSSEAKANSEWLRLQGEFASELAALRPLLVPVNVAAGSLFRLQAHVENEAQARAVCAALSEKSQACVVVLPHH